MDKKEKRTRALELLRDNGCWFLGCALYATAVNSFALPNSIAQSGLTGLAILINRFSGVPVGVLSLLLNLPLLILMWIFIGKRSVLHTLWVTVILAAALDLFALFLPAYQGDKILATLLCGALEGAGLGLIMITGATSGGTDIVGRLIHQRWPHITVGTVVRLADAAVVTANMIAFRSIESGLYAIIAIFVSTKVIDAMIYGAGSGKLLMIITDRAHDVANAIITSSRRGVSIIPVEGAYTGENKNMLMCVAKRHEINTIIKTAKSVDSHTFIIVSEANEILGNGFKKNI